MRQAFSELDSGQYRVVRKALRERLLMMRNAPHLTGVRQFIIPCFTFSQAVYYGIGLKIYDWLSWEADLPGSFFEGRTKALARIPGLKSNGLCGIVAYADGQFDDARYNLALVQSCAASGGDVLNYARVVGFEKNERGRLSAVIVEERQSAKRFRLAARSFVNATGPYSDRIRQMAADHLGNRLKLSRGVHILLPLPPDFGSDAVLIPETDDGRVIFAIPWQGRLLVGTTETESTLEVEKTVTKAEAEYLLRHLNRYLLKPFDRSAIVSAIAGLRPLVQSKKTLDPRKMIRDYEIEVEPRSGLISVLGGKWTVYRAMAEDAINDVQRSLMGRTTECRTRNYPLFGSEENREEAVRQLMEVYEMPVETVKHLVEKFGTCAGRVLELARADPVRRRPIVAGAPQIQAEVVYSVREEMAVTIEDVLGRRLGLQFFDWGLAIEAAPVVGSILGQELAWTRQHTEEEVQGYVDQIRAGSRALGLELAPAGRIQ